MAECPFATRRTREPVGWVLSVPCNYEAVRVYCDDWCQLYDRDARDCKLVTQTRATVIPDEGR